MNEYTDLLKYAIILSIPYRILTIKEIAGVSEFNYNFQFPTGFSLRMKYNYDIANLNNLSIPYRILTLFLIQSLRYMI